MEPKLQHSLPEPRLEPVPPQGREPRRAFWGHPLPAQPTTTPDTQEQRDNPALASFACGCLPAEREGGQSGCSWVFTPGTPHRDSRNRGETEHASWEHHSLRSSPISANAGHHSHLPEQQWEQFALNTSRDSCCKQELGPLGPPQPPLQPPAPHPHLF